MIFERTNHINAVEVKTKKEANGKNILIFSILFTVSFFAVFSSLFLNGKSLIWKADGLGQYYPAFLYIGKYIRTFIKGLLQGSFNLPAFDLSIGMGEDVVGTLNYYGFGDPINIFAVFANQSNGHIVYEILFFARLYLAGLAFYVYAKKMKIKGWCGVIGSLAYCFSGWMLYGAVSYIEWLSVLIYFPLMLLGCECILRKEKGRFWLLLGALYGALSGFYFLYMSSLALAVYALVRTAFHHKGKGMAVHIRFIFCCLLWYIPGVLIAAPILLPTMQSFFGSERSGISVSEILTDVTNYIPVFQKDYWKAVLKPFVSQKNLINGILIPLTDSSGLLVVLPQRIIKWNKKRVQLLLALGILVLGLHIPMTNYLFNAFGEANNRWVFLLYFVLALIFAFVISEITDKIEGRDLDRKKKRKAYAKRRSISRVITVLAALLTVLNIAVDGILLYGEKGQNWQDEFISSAQLNETYIASPVNQSAVIAQDNEVYRVWTSTLTWVNHRPENVAMLDGYNGMTYWFSIINGRTQTYVNLVNDMAYTWRSFGLNHCAAAETMMGVKYLMTNNPDEIPSGCTLVEEVEFNGQTWQVYENPSFTSLAEVRSTEADEKAWSECLGETSVEDLTEMARNTMGAGSKFPIDGSAFKNYLEAIENDISANDYGTVSSFTYENDKITVEATVTDGDEVVIAVPYNTNWKVTVDGTEMTIKDKDIMNMSVEGLSEGEHTIVLTYVPTAFYIGVAVSLLTIIFLVVVTLCARKSKKSRWVSE